MKLTSQIKLLPTKDQHQALKETLETVNQASNYISQLAFESKTFKQYDLHKLAYYDIRARFGLSAQMTVRAVAKVADSYKLDRDVQRVFKATGGIAYDDRVLRYDLQADTVSIWTMGGRIKVPFICGDRQRELLKSQQGESDLILFRGDFYLLATCDIADPDPLDVEGVLGIDLGIIQIATTSDGESFSGSQVNRVRHRHRRLRKKLQSKGTKSAKRRLKKLSGKERRFAKDVNHVISKKIVQTAVDTNKAIAVEKLTGIRDRVRLRRGQRDNLHNWSFYQLKVFIAYKAKLAGIPVIEVDPRNTSRECASCGHIDKANRKSQSKFLCVVCNHAANADENAAVVIGRRAAVNRPYVSTPSA